MSNHTLSETLRNLYEVSLVGVDPLIDQWPLMHSPIPVISIVLGYLIFVKKIGPKMMENHKPFNLREVLVAYNALQVALCCYIVCRVFAVENCFDWLFSFGCRYQADRDRSLAELVWCGTYWYWVAKMLDLLDTIFFVLRKKSNQISFLHVYHHTLMAFTSWYYLKYMPGEYLVCLGFPSILTFQLKMEFSLASSTHWCTSSCTSTTALVLWVHNIENICGGRSTSRVCSWLNL